jgi:putative restriction endonuclease
MDIDLAIRLKAFSWLSEKTSSLGDVLPRALLQTGFIYEDTRVPLVAPQGIFKPKILDMPLSITTTPESPYSDVFTPDGLLTYKYRGTDPNHPDNNGLRRAISAKRPLIYFHGVVPGQYLAVWPVYIVGDDSASLSFKVAVDDIANVEVQTESLPVISENTIARRAYITATVKLRLHQRSFRERVLDAYRTQCALCHLRHKELLDAAHILPDSTPEGEPLITNGIALCKLHHAAYDSFILGVSPDYIVHIRQDVLEEHDGPILQHGLKELNGAKLLLPHELKNWPNKDALSQRFEQFSRAI